MSFGLSLVMGVLYWCGTNKFWYGTQHLARQPLVLAVPIGIIMGDLSNSMKIGAALQLIYLGAIAPGGQLPSDEALAAAIAIPLALQYKLAPEIAVSIAMPLGMLGVLLDNLKRTYHSYFVRRADMEAEKKNRKKMEKNEFLYPFLLSLPLRIIPVTLGLYFGGDAIQSFLESLPAWAIHGLSVAGGILPALGFAITIMTIGTKKNIPYFIIGFALASYAGINMIGLSVFGACLALIHSQFVTKESKIAENGNNVAEEGDF
uniref:PTS mannose/fructose/sorbose/N-acetylgalactosamine transporter subunit IIC n=1 Tax=Ndongobacter massiliensis TaxID=1871025 RepID=UPI0009316788|nr:PTS sugar transporter subunit IIC [Ndongobacter massiliensis]